MASSQPGRITSTHGPKRAVLGNPAKAVAPSWKENARIPSGPAAMTKGKVPADSGSKIFLSQLPVDVTDAELEDLFRKTVGPVKETFLVYNSQGKSRGMAVVSFHRPGDGLLAQAKYDGRVIDGRRPIKLELIIDRMPTSSAPPPPTQPTSLLSRLAPAPAPARPSAPPPTSTPRSMLDRVAPASTKTVPRRPARRRKGPKTVNKSMTVADLDHQMDDYRQSADSAA